MPRKLPYREGDAFAVPLRGGGWALGVVARMAPRGRILLGYFFGPRLADVPAALPERVLRPEDAVLVGHFGDLGLMQGEWPVLGAVPGWSRDDWSTTTFVRRDAITEAPSLIGYDDDDPGRELSARRCSPEEADGLPKDGLMGAGAVEIALARLLPSSRSEP